MSRFPITLSSVNDVKTFVGLASACPCEVDVISGRYLVNGKSIMGLFSIDLSGPVSVELSKDGEEAEKLKNRLQPYMP